jgi:hypothetical protein
MGPCLGRDKFVVERPEKPKLPDPSILLKANEQHYKNYPNYNPQQVSLSV